MKSDEICYKLPITLYENNNPDTRIKGEKRMNETDEKKLMADIQNIKSDIKKCKNICKCKNCLWGRCIVLVLCIIGLIVFSTCCASKVQTVTEIVNNTENTSDNRHIVNTTIESTNVLWNNPYFCFFLIACLGLIGAIVFFLCTCCREKTKQNLLTEAYDKALKKLEDKTDKKITETPGKCFQKPKKETVEHSTGAITKIFETYCQNITSK